MIGRWASKNAEDEPVEPTGFDAFELRLGDLMRGERATLGKSLLDVQRELRIKAAYIAAIENADPDRHPRFHCRLRSVLRALSQHGSRQGVQGILC